MLNNKSYFFSFFEVSFDEHFFLSLVIAVFLLVVFFFFNNIFLQFLDDIILTYVVMFNKTSDLTKFFLSHFFVLSIFNIQFHIILLDIFEKILLTFIDFLNINLKISDSYDPAAFDF